MKSEYRLQQQQIKVQKQNFMGILELLQMSMELSKTRKDIKLIAEYQVVERERFKLINKLNNWGQIDRGNEQTVERNAGFHEIAGGHFQRQPIARYDCRSALLSSPSQR